MSDITIQDLKEKLLVSNWPKCNELASEIGSYNNNEAMLALIEALNSGSQHHIRTAAIKALTVYNAPEVIEALKKRLDDSAYEPRVEAKKALKELTGVEYKTSRGE